MPPDMDTIQGTVKSDSRPKRRTRFVCVSDTHNQHVKLPKGDVLIHAGDLTNQGGYSELASTLTWLDKADFECKIIVAGNHDLTLDPDFCANYRNWFANQAHTPEQCREILDKTETLTYLAHESKTIKLTSPTGPRTTFKVFGSPLSGQFGTWAFMYDRPSGTAIWDAIPLDTDILITHSPPYGLLDLVTRTNENAGCVGLRQALWRARPLLSVFGHIHEGRGAVRVKWDLDAQSLAENDVEEGYRIKAVTSWQDPAPDGNKISLCDLTEKGPGGALDNDGAPGQSLSAISVPRTTVTKWIGNAAPVLGRRGIGGQPDDHSQDVDVVALVGRMGRKESCLVNASIKTDNYHERSQGSNKTLNKAIVVDLYLPVMAGPESFLCSHDSTCRH